MRRGIESVKMTEVRRDQQTGRDYVEIQTTEDEVGCIHSKSF